MTDADKPAKIVLIGCGGVAQQYYMPALKALQHAGIAELVAAFDPSAERSSAVKKDFPSCEFLSDFEEAASTQSEIAIVASPNSVHKAQTMKLLESGTAVLCEKPLAIAVSDAESVVVCADRVGSPLSVGFVRRHFPACQSVKDLLDRQILGAVQSFRFVEGSQFSWPLRSMSLFDHQTAGGGVLIDIGSHVLDLMIWWFGNPSDVTYLDDAMGGSEANCKLTVSFPSGVNGIIRLSRDLNLKNKYVIQCEKGWISWRPGQSTELELGFVNCERYHTSTVTTHGSPAHDFEQSFASQILNLIDATRGKARLMVPGSVAIESLRLIEHCYKNRNLMEMPWLSESELLAARAFNRVGAS